MLLCALVACAACVSLLLLDGGSSTPELNVGAAAYAATAPQAGIVEAVFLAHSHRAGGHSTFRQQEWLDAGSNERRELDTVQEPTARPAIHEVNDWVFAPRSTQEWTGGKGLGTVHIRRLPSGRRFQAVSEAEHNLSESAAHVAFAGIGMNGVEGVELFRSLYRMGRMRLVGRVERGGRRLWKLESHEVRVVGRGAALRNIEGHTRLIVLVDPKSFLPVREEQVDVARPGHPRVLVESELISYRRLPDDAVHRRLFDLRVQHPHARVLVSRARLPIFVPLHPKGAPCPCYAVRGLRPRRNRRRAP